MTIQEAACVPSRHFRIAEMTSQTFAIRRVQAFCYRYPLSTPVVTSFGRMLNRSAVFVRVEDEDGQVGWGEVWANFPSTGAERRARLVNEVLAPTLSGFAANEPSDVFDTLTRGSSVLALKLKIGFDLAADRANLASLHQLVGDGMLAADANQAWSTERALEIAPHLAEFGLAWLEEPIRADRPWQEWQRLREGVGLPLAAGENITSRAGFEQVLGDDVLRVVQPDIAKWGGLSVCSGIARDILRSGKIFCPHYLGGGIGLLASAHLLAGVGGDGLLEVDANDNPLRDRFCGPVADIRNGMVTLSDNAGLGIEPDLLSIEQYRTA